MRRTNRMVLGLVAVFVLGSSLALLGCGGDDDDNNIVDLDQTNAAALVGGKAFTFPADTGFGIANATLTFNTSATRFAITTATNRATGAVRYGSCIFTVGSSSTDPGAPVTVPGNPVGGGSNFPAPGPRPNQEFSGSCRFDNDTNALILNGIGSASTQPGTGTFGG